MKSQLPYLLLVAGSAAAIWLAAPVPSTAQGDGDDPAVPPLLADVAAQQTTIQENQNKIDEKFALIAEDVRQARLFAGRGR